MSYGQIALHFKSSEDAVRMMIEHTLNGLKEKLNKKDVIFSLLFALFVGATTPNFGTLCRYKIPCMPFYIISLFLIMDKYGKLKLKSSPFNKVAA